MKRTLFLIGLIGLMAVFTGCKLVDQDRVRDDRTETKPWNERADWEDSTLGAPF